MIEPMYNLIHLKQAIVAYLIVGANQPESNAAVQTRDIRCGGACPNHVVVSGALSVLTRLDRVQCTAGSEDNASPSSWRTAGI